MKHVYVLMGQTGEYSDRTEWPVGAWKYKHQAEKKITELTNKMEELGLNGYSPSLVTLEAKKEMLKLDPGFNRDTYTGTSYYYNKVPLYT